MRQVNKGRMAFTALLLIFALVFVIVSFSYGTKARIIPLMVAIVTMIIGVPLLVNEIHPVRLIRNLDISVMDLGGEASTEESEQRPSGKRFLGVVTWFTLFFALIVIAGFHIGIGAFALTFLKFQGRLSWPKAGMAAVLLWGTMFLLFEVALGFGLFKGLLFGELMPDL